MSHQSRFCAQYWMLGAGTLGRPRGMVQGGRREEGSGWGTRVYLWWIHVDIWQNQYNIVKLKNKIKKKTRNETTIRPSNPTPRVGLYPEETGVEKDTCIPLFIVALFTIARTWKQPRCPSTDEWIKNCGTYTQCEITHP